MPISQASNFSNIFSAQVPSTPFNGLIWNELDTNGFLIESWYRNNNYWWSGLKTLSSHNVFTSNVNFQFAADIRYDYQLNNIHLTLLCDGALDTTNNYVYLNLYRRSGASSFPVVINQNFTNLAANTVENFNIPLDYAFLTSGSNLLSFTYYRMGSNSMTIRASTLLNYQLRRK